MHKVVKAPCRCTIVFLFAFVEMRLRLKLHLALDINTVPHLGIELITACRPSLDPLNVSCTVPLRLGVVVSDSSSSSSSSSC